MNSLQFCINKDQDNPSYMETRVVKIKSDTGFKIILGSRHIDDIVKEREEQNKQLNEALKKSAHTMKSFMRLVQFIKVSPPLI